NIAVWDIPSETLGVRFSAKVNQDDSLAGLTFSPNGATLATASEEGHLRFWEPRTGHMISQRSLPGAVFRTLSFRPPDGRQILTVDADNRVMLWNTGGDT